MKLNDKIREALGEELSKQVEAVESDIELAVFNDGTVVPAEKYDTLKAEHKSLNDKYEKDIKDANSKLESAIKNSGDVETLKSTLEKVQSENSDLIKNFETEKLNIKKTNAIEVALLKANVDEDYLAMAKTQINVESLNFEGDSLLGLDESINKLRTSFPKLFGEIKKTGTPPDDGGLPIKTEKAKLIEAYNQAEKSANARLMMSLQEQIKQLE